MRECLCDYLTFLMEKRKEYFKISDLSDILIKNLSPEVVEPLATIISHDLFELYKEDDVKKVEKKGKRKLDSDVPM